MWKRKLFTFFIVAMSILSFLPACKKNGSDAPNPPPPPPDTTVVIAPAIDPPVASTIGFFLNDWQPINFVRPAYLDTTVPSSAPYTVTIDRSNVLTKVPRSLFGNNSNIWMTQMVTEPALIDHLTALHPHIIRFPGGSISDIFFWNAMPNVPPVDAPDQLVKADGSSAPSGYWFGKNAANWTLSVDNYYNMLQQTGNKGIITINYGYARYGKSANPVANAAHLAADWVRYDNGRTQYWEIGNENYGDWEAGYRINLANNQDGQPEFLSGQLYGQHFKVFVDSMQKAAQEIGKTIYIGSVMVEAAAQSWETSTRRNWNTGMLPQVNSKADFYVVHNYFTPYNTNSNATEVLNSAKVETSKMMDFVKQSWQANAATPKPVALDEWNIFAVNSKQMVSHVNGMHAVLLLGEALKSGYGMAARWDLANGWENGNDHGMFNIGDEPDGVPKWSPRPAFFHMYFFQKFLGDRCVGSSISNTTEVSTYASSFTSGEVAVTLVNNSTTFKTVEIKVQNFRKGSRYYWYTLSGGTDNGEFSRKVYVNGKSSTYASGGPSNYSSLLAYSASTSNGIRVTVPARAVVCVAIDKQ
ncbi:MAG: alpha-L-arabinofuranosidase [Chitinophagaceae bacterium]|nr:alpha-L-arabinofuranosidase [Chitinophagaceae bacterium]